MDIKRILVVFSLLIPQIASAWGRDGHELIAYVGANLAFNGKMFWGANAKNFVRLTTVPDMYWKQGNLYLVETQTHFFQPDSYYSQPSQFHLIPHDFNLLVNQFGQKQAVEDGTAPWRINQFYQRALQALKARDFKSAVEMAGAMSHYIGDLSQPLHTTENYDGQKTHNQGVHKFFETTNVHANLQTLNPSVMAQAAVLMKKPSFQNQFNGTVVDALFNELYRAYSAKDTLIKTDIKFGRVGAGAQMQLEIAKDRLADGAASLAIILSHLWAESGLQDTGATGAISIPPWVAPNYYTPTNPPQEVSKEALDYRLSTLRGAVGDDCNL